MECPTCGAQMYQWDHGICSKCKEYCGCSFMPTSMSDYCTKHRPRFTKEPA